MYWIRFLNSHTLSQCEDSILFKKIDDDVEKGDGDVSSGYGFKNRRTLSQYDYSSSFNDIDGYVDKGDVISVYGSINIHTDLQLNGLESLMNDNDSINKKMNETL